MRLPFSLLLVLGSTVVSASWRETVAAAGLDASRVTMLTGEAPGFKPAETTVEVRSVIDRMDPRVPIIWQEPVVIPRYAVPAQATVFTRERWTGAPVAAGYRDGRNIIFWTAADPGSRGFERFPYLPQALMELGLQPTVATRSLWAFFDSSYRLRADPDYLATRWRRGGIQAIHIAAWHYWEPEAARDAWLAALISACHRRAITVYAWLEFPHVSERFWLDHPEWREKTATGQDALLDWRKLMNLADRECSETIDRSLASLLKRFDWDGVNLGELYFESLEGFSNPARFTPFNRGVLGRFEAETGLRAASIFDSAHPEVLSRFLAFRARLAHELQSQWLERLSVHKKDKPWLDLALTHVDDRFDQSMREKLGADAAALLPVAARHATTFMVEDPATIWHLGPERYHELARRYAPLVQASQPLAVDINVVERYQDVYPTRQITGGELFETLHAAAQAFPRVAVYFENSILQADWPLVPYAATTARVTPQTDGSLQVDSAQQVAVRWEGCAMMDGLLWPAVGEGTVIVPPGRHSLSACPPASLPALRLADLNGSIIDLKMDGDSLQLTYHSDTRAFAVLARDGTLDTTVLPAGTHNVRLK